MSLWTLHVYKLCSISTFSRLVLSHAFTPGTVHALYNCTAWQRGPTIMRVLWVVYHSYSFSNQWPELYHVMEGCFCTSCTVKYDEGQRYTEILILHDKKCGKIWILFNSVIYFKNNFQINIFFPSRYFLNNSSMESWRTFHWGAMEGQSRIIITKNPVIRTVQWS